MISCTPETGHISPRARRSLAETIQLGFLLPAVLIPALVPSMIWWPVIVTFIVLAYFVCSARMPSLRVAPAWFRAGRLDDRIIAATIAVSVIACLILISWSQFEHPDFSAHAARITERTTIMLVVTGVCFSILNATIEETAFRGLLQTLLSERFGALVAVSTQAVLFGIGHFAGVPGGSTGVVLATVYGLVLGLIRLWSGGLAACILSHVALDATIFTMVASSLP